MTSIFSKIITKSIFRYQHNYKLHKILFSTKKKKLPKTWVPTTTMFIPDPDNPGKYKLSKSHNIKYQYDSSEGKHIETPNEPSLVEEIEAAFEEDIEEEKSKDVAFMENYKWVIVSLMGMILILGAGFSLGFTTININKAMEYNNNTNSKKKNSDKKTHIFDLLFSKFQSNESIIKNRHKTIATIIFELQMHANDCMLLNVDNRYKNKKERENLYLEMLDKNEIQQDKNTFEKQLCENVIGIKWPAIDLTDFDIDDISDTHWDFSKYINDIKNNEIQLKFPPPFDTMRYGEAKKKKLMWIYSNKHLEWFQVVMTFNNTLQRIEDLNLVAIRLRFKEYFCYPMLNKNGTTDIKKWIIETRKYDPRVEHLRRLRRHVTYYKK
eukprot:496272_1